MKATGIVRKIDELGRIVLPIELRRTLNIGIKDSLEIFVDGENIVLKQYRPCCIFCGEGNDTISMNRTEYRKITSLRSFRLHLKGKLLLCRGLCKSADDI